jgi:hypothetical protein
VNRGLRIFQGWFTLTKRTGERTPLLVGHTPPGSF